MLLRVACMSWMVAALGAACEDEPPPIPPSASDRAVIADPANKAYVAKNQPDPRPRVVPLDSAVDLRSALRGATGAMTALWTMVDRDRGLDVYVADDDSATYLCQLEQSRANGFPYMIDSGDRWTCDESRSRCTSVDAAGGSGYSFHFVPGRGDGPRRLAAIVRYGSRRVPAEDPAPVAAFVAASGSVCRLRAAVAEAGVHAPAEADMPEELWRYRHPLVGADDDNPEGAVVEQRLCGSEARRAAAALLREIAALRNPVGCDHAPLACTYSSPFSERRLYARNDAAGRVAPWAVADLSSLPTPGDAAREDRDVAAFLRRAAASPCP